MKLKTKLIPLAGVAAVCATVAPFTITSCGTNTGNGFVDLTKRYVSTIDFYRGYEFQDFLEATTKYADNASVNPEIFVNDYLWSMSRNVRATQSDQSKTADKVPEITTVVTEFNEAERNINRMKSKADKYAEDAAANFSKLSIAEMENVASHELYTSRAAIANNSAWKKQYNISDKYLGLASTHNAKMSDVSITAIPYFAFANASIPTISLKLEIEYEYTYIDAVSNYDLNAKVNDKVAYKSDYLMNMKEELKRDEERIDAPMVEHSFATITLTNVPFQVYPYTSASAELQGWWVSPCEQLMAGVIQDEEETKSWNEQHPWSISVDVARDTLDYQNSAYGLMTFTTSQSRNLTLKSEDIEDEASSETIDEITSMIEELSFVSYYYNLIPLVEINPTPEEV